MNNPFFARTKSKKSKKAINDKEKDKVVTGKKRKLEVNDDEESIPSSEDEEVHETPELVVFDGLNLKKNNGANIYEWKAFMSPKLSKMDDATNSSKMKSTTKEKEEEELNKRHDAELEELLKTTKLLDLYTAEQLSGKELRKHKEKQMINLGAKPPKGDKVPTPIGLGILRKKLKKETKELEEAKNLGLYHQSIKNNWAASAKKNNDKRDRGIGVGIGKIKGGILMLSSQDIKRVQNSGDTSRNLGIGRGGMKDLMGRRGKSKK
ncbi:5173_t:CDS:2 [Ambispora gerdemannii]|uniref:5173_t:CDS:1 n=1 Tax=Ambispora gerdemannii TaxID=144530 RepID=A0A9N9GPC7_9GLOM|nr:5173_t:CDS:2 [Ambispora gerdemannii]